MSTEAETYGSVVRAVLWRNYGAVRHGEKLLARAIGVSPRTVSNWLRGACAPRGEELVRLMAECDELTAEINRLVQEAKCSRS